MHEKLNANVYQPFICTDAALTTFNHTLQDECKQRTKRMFDK